MLNKQCPIGVFDSGIGGLTVVRALARLLPNEDIIYFGDTARVPYGTKSRSSIIRFSKENARILLKKKVKIIVVACNSSSSYAIPSLRKLSSVPVIGVIAPGVSKAVSATWNRRIGVIATPATVNSGSYPSHIKKRSKTCKVYQQACPLFVPLVEEGWANRRITASIAREYLKDIKKAGCDCLILGCTHYPLLKNSLQKIMGKSVFLVDSAREVASEVKCTLSALGALNPKRGKGRFRFLISDDPGHFQKVAKKFLPLPAKHVSRADHGVSS